MNASAPMKRLLIGILLLLAERLIGQQPIVYAVDLTDQRNDQLSVSVELPALGRDEVTFAFPRMVPGIYGAMDHGRLVHALLAFDEQGGPMRVRRVDVNTYRIEEGARLRRIEYAVDDGWEEFEPLYQQGMYRSCEAMFKPDAPVLNQNALFGYVMGEEDRPIEVRMRHAPEHYPATSLPRHVPAPGAAVFAARGYRHLVDHPMIVARPDTVELRIGEARVLVACHSATGALIAPMIAKQVEPLLRDQLAYLRGLPVDRYTLLVYHAPTPDPHAFLADGLEHATSTLVLLCLPLEEATLGGVVSSIISHEVFHTLLPINLHGEGIARYDMADPRVGDHLWLYEGMTEYFALHMPVARGRITTSEFLAHVEEKIAAMRGFPDDEALTVLSRHAVDRQDQYPNFYQKGALFCLMLDLELRALSNGRYGAVDLCRDMADAYGPHKPFSDDALFAEMARVSGHPSIEGYLRDHLERPARLDVEAQLRRAGIVRGADGTLVIDAKAGNGQKALRKAWLGR